MPIPGDPPCPETHQGRPDGMSCGRLPDAWQGRRPRTAEDLQPLWRTWQRVNRKCYHSRAYDQGEAGRCGGE